MRHSFYANNSKVIPGVKKKNKPGFMPKPTHTKKGSLENNILNLRVNNLMEAYKDDPKVIEDLKGTISIFLVNLTVARDINSKVQEKTLKKEFSGYLTKLEKEIKNNG